MKINLIIFSILMSVNAFAYQRAYVVRTTSGNVIIPLNRGNNQQSQALKGQGMTFVTTVEIETKKEMDPTTQKEKEVKVYKSWVRGCDKVILPSKKDEEKRVNQGDHVELRFSQAGSCNVIDWKKM
jgi:hypothetical protein